MAIVIGGSSGIGRAFGLELARLGATVLFSGRSPAALESAVAEAHRLGGAAFHRPVDVRDAGAVEEVVAAALNHAGRLDLMFNGAGGNIVAYEEEMTLDGYAEVLSTNLMGVIHGVHAAYRVMKKQRHGHIVNVSSLAGLVPMPASSAYCAAKFGVVGLSQALRLEARDFGVNVSVVCPAAVRTPIFERAEYINFDKDKFLASPPPGGFQSTEECARQILDGIRRNRAVITPGKAGAISALARHFPGLWQLAGRGVARKLREIRSTPPPPLPTAQS